MREIVESGWADALEPVADQVAAMGDFLRAEVAAGRSYLPSGPNVLRAFTQPFDDVRVLIVGQDPYPTPGHPVGLSFSVAPDVRPLPRSLQNIFRELAADLGHATPSTGDLSPWAQHGRATAQQSADGGAGSAGLASRQGLGSRYRAGDSRTRRPRYALVAILWGRDAQTLRPMLGDTACIESAHPSPMSADRGFFGSRPFSRAGELLAQQGGEAIDWKLP